jgi:hypothetical protein
MIEKAMMDEVQLWLVLVADGRSRVDVLVPLACDLARASSSFCSRLGPQASASALPFQPACASLLAVSTHVPQRVSASFMSDNNLHTLHNSRTRNSCVPHDSSRQQPHQPTSSTSTTTSTNISSGSHTGSSPMPLNIPTAEEGKGMAEERVWLWRA